MTRRVACVGTDTGVGKTEVVCRLLRQARARGVSMLPFKPVQSGDDDPGASDAERLCAAAGRSREDAEWIAPLRYAAPLAPGIADDPTPFLRPAVLTDGLAAPLARACAAQRELLARHDPAWLLVELAGGLWVPMPGGSWQPSWITALADDVIVIARAGLGTINHCLLTIDALHALGLEPRGVILCECVAPDPSNEHNAAVITAARAIPVVGTLHHRRDDDDLLTPLLRALA
ncbi:MAG: dethiobiotin synthase [Deltaproteobacteria bacterium]|nr:dethiobiotin synthase [Deltaproteobacteria bacterium]MBK8713116.1 dethiobiotin synthase [Deltaproteobacteria bacterium]MBP7286694.1 dethiobiotin synthase [Nannocystaceae bacterium]